MASNPIKGDDLLDLKSIQKNVDAAIALSNKLSEVLAKNAEMQLKTLKLVNINRKDSVESLQKEEDATEALTKEVEENEKANKELLKIKKQLEKSSDKEVKGRLKLAKVTKLQRDILKDQIILQDKEAGTLQKIAATNRVLRREREKLNLETSLGRQRLLEINSALDANNNKIKENSDQLKKQRLNVGNYKDDVKEAIEETGLFDGQLGGLVQGFNQARKATLKVIRSLRTFKGALTATGIGAIVLGLLSLFKAFTANAEGARSFEKIMAVVSATVSVLVGRLIKVGKALTGFGTAIVAVFSFDFDTAGKAASSAISDIGDSFTGFTDEVEKAVEGSLKLVEAQQQLRDTTRGLRIEIANLSKEEENQRQIADDATRSFAEREEAADRARIASEARAAAQNTLAQEELKNTNERIRLLSEVDQVTEDLLDEQVTAQETAIEAEKELLLVQRENEKQRNELRQDRLERDLDFLLDIFDNQKTINEQIIADETKTFAERQMLLAETVRLGAKSFKEQTEIIEEFAGQSINFNELLAESDAKVVQERIRSFGLSEIVEGRALEIIRDRKTAIQDLSVAEKDLAKARQEQIDKNLATEIVSITEFTAQQLKIRETALLKLGKTQEEIQKDLTDARISLLTQEAIQLEALGEDTIDQELEIARLRVKIDEDANKEILSQRKALNSLIKDQSIALVENITDTALEINQQVRDEELEGERQKIEEENTLLDEQVANGLKTEEQAAVIRASREAEFEEKEKKIKRNAARAEKNSEIFKATIAGIRAVIEAGGLTPLGIATGIFNAANIALLASKPIPKFKDGGIFDPETGMIGGASHAMGGTTFYDGSGNPMFEAQKGEKLYIINDKAVPFYDWINSMDKGDISSSGGGMSDARMVAELKKNKPMSVNQQYDLADYTARQTAKEFNNQGYYGNRYR